MDETTQRALWRATATGGLDSRAVDHLHDGIVNASQQNARLEAADRLRSVVLSEPPELKRRVTALAVELVAEGQDAPAGRAGIAADLIIAAQGASHGSVTELRNRFDAIRAKHSTAFNGGRATGLEQLNLLTKPKPKAQSKGKSLLGRILGQ